MQQLDATRLGHPIVLASFALQFVEEHRHGEEQLGADQERRRAGRARLRQMAVDESLGVGLASRCNRCASWLSALARARCA